MEIFISLIGYIAVMLTALSLSKIDWCEIQGKYCGEKEHIGCVPNSFPHEKSCRNVSVLPMDLTTKKLLVHLHNHYRNKIAAGKIGKFPEASRMGVMQWDDTLQETAELHVSHCHFAHDQCRATPQYPYSGQNIYFQATVGYEPNSTDAIERGLKGWFEEWKMAKPSIVDRVTTDQTKVFHFTVMVNDRNNYVGCGMIQYKTKEKAGTMDAFMLTCNYQYTNIINQPLYQKGRHCSNCSSGYSTRYKALCKN